MVPVLTLVYQQNTGHVECPSLFDFLGFIVAETVLLQLAKCLFLLQYFKVVETIANFRDLGLDLVHV